MAKIKYFVFDVVEAGLPGAERSFVVRHRKDAERIIMAEKRKAVRRGYKVLGNVKKGRIVIEKKDGSWRERIYVVPRASFT